MSNLLIFDLFNLKLQLYPRSWVHSEDDDQTKGSHTHVEDGDDEREDSRSRLGLKTTTKRTSRKTKPSGRTNKRTSKQQPVATTEDEDDFMSVGSSCADSDHQSEQIQQHHQQPQTASTALPVSSSSSQHLSTAPSTSNAAAAAAAAASSGGTGCGTTSGTTKSKKNRVTVLSDVPLNMNEYLDLVGNIVASSRIGAARPFAAVAPIPLVKVEKEEPLDDYDGVDINMEEQKPSLDHASGSSSSNSSSNERGTTSVIRMASTSANGNNSSPEDLTQAALTPLSTTAMSLQAIKVEVEATKLLPQRFTAPAQQRGPKKLVIKPKATATASATATTTTKKTDNNAASSSSSSSSTSKICVESLSISAKVQGPTGELVQIKSERTEASGSSILEKHLTTSYATTQQQQVSRKHSSVNDEDARVLLEFANSNSKQQQQQAQSGNPFVVNAASFASAGSVFANASGSPSARNSNRGDEYILPDDNDLEVDEIVISSSSSFASTSQQQQQEQTHHQPTPTPQAHLQPPPGFNDFNFLYHQNTSAITATTTASNFTPFGLQQQQQQHQQHGSSEATNAATLASSSSNSSALDHDSSMNATFRVAKPQSSLGGWYHAHDQPEPQSQPQQQQQAHTSTHGQNVEQSSNFIAALAAVDCCSVAVDSDASDAKYLDLDTCKREQLSNSSSHLPSVSASTSTTSSSFAAAATESSLVGGLGLNIRTDEKMPAKGEISEQESNCDIENSWSQSVSVLTIKLVHINNSYLNPLDVRRHITALL